MACRAVLPVKRLVFARNDVLEGKSSLFSESTCNLTTDGAFWHSNQPAVKEHRHYHLSNRSNPLPELGELLPDCSAAHSSCRLLRSGAD